MPEVGHIDENTTIETTMTISVLYLCKFNQKFLYKNIIIKILREYHGDVM
ncbi:hypothetical protein [Thermococcus sp.]